DPAGLDAGELGGLEVAAHGVDVPAEDGALADEAVDQDQCGQQDQHHGQTAGVGQLPGEGHHHGGDHHVLDPEQPHRLHGLQVLDLRQTAAPLLDDEDEHQQPGED